MDSYFFQPQFFGFFLHTCKKLYDVLYCFYRKKKVRDKYEIVFYM